MTERRISKWAQPVPRSARKNAHLRQAWLRLRLFLILPKGIELVCPLLAGLRQLVEPSISQTATKVLIMAAEAAGH
jgi:hypothetical protein